MRQQSLFDRIQIHIHSVIQTKEKNSCRSLQDLQQNLDLFHLVTFDKVRFYIVVVTTELNRTR